ncbi:MAG: transglutaminase-like domain-containing protein [Candidatus Micrarchaeia archaeon]
MHNFKRKEIILYISFFFLFTLTVSYAKPTKALLNVTMNWDIVADGIIDNATLDVTIPTNSQNQKIISSEFSDSFKIVSGTESKIRFEFGGIRSKRITANFLIQTDYINRNNDSNTLTKSYVNETEYIIINEDIKNLSKLFVSSFPYDLYEMQNWVYRNIKYNSSYTDVTISDITLSNMPSDWVLQKRTGVCDEFSNLFAALARSKNYSTRIIIGYAYIDKKWIPHAWSEVYDPNYGWIEIDPTHNQFLNLNALRVRTGTGEDISLLHDSISAISKDAKKINLEEKVDIEIINFTEEDPIEVNIVFSPQPPLDQNQPTIVKITNKENSPIFVNALFIPPVSVECSDCLKQIILEPKKMYQMEFNLRLPPLSPNVRYTFPNTFLTDYEKTEISFERVHTEQSLSEKYTDIQSLPNEFQMFVGLFVVAAVAIVAIAILLGL